MDPPTETAGEAAFEIRSPVSPGDWKQAAAMLHDYIEWISVAAGVDPFERQQALASEIADPAGTYSGTSAFLILAFEGPLAIGMIACRYHDEQRAELKRLYVRPVARRRGYGGHLVSHLLDVVRNSGHTEVWLEATKGLMDPALAVYRRNGFVEAVERSTNIEVDNMVVLQRSVEPLPIAGSIEEVTHPPLVFSDEMRQMVDDGLGFVASVNTEGTPNVSPKGTLAAWSDDQLVFADIASPATSANLERRPAVEVNVVDPLIRRGYRFAGTATVHRSGDSFEQAIRFFEERGTVDVRRRVRAVVIITVTRSRHLRSPAYALGYTENELKQRYLRLLAGATDGRRPTAGPSGAASAPQQTNRQSPYDDLRDGAP